MINRTGWLACGVLLAVSGGLPGGVWAAPTTDSAAHATYDDGWSNSDVGGWTSGWTLTTSGSAGSFVGNSKNNGDGDSNSDHDINTPLTASGRAWGLWANSGGVSNAVRALPATMAVGDKFKLKMDNGWITTSNTVGMALRNSSSENLIEVFFVGGSSFYQVNHHGGVTNTTLGFSDEGLDLEFELMSTSTMKVTITRLEGGSYSNTFSLMSPSGGQGVAQVRLFNASAGSGSNYDAFFNSFEFEPFTNVEDWAQY